MKPIPFPSESLAREFARAELKNTKIIIVHSPHPNYRDKNQDYFIDAPDSMIRNWETLVFEGKGKDA